MTGFDNEEYAYKNQTGSGDIYHILKENARKNRNNATLAEEILWKYLRKKRLGWKFRRQHPVNDFIADFICLDKHLIIEVDGGYHNIQTQREADNLRSDILNKQGFYVIRFTNEQIFNEIDYVTNRIKELLALIK